MSKEKYFNLIDYGASKIRFSVFDKNYNEKYSETVEVIYEQKYNNHFEEIVKIIKKAEKNISFHIEDVIVILDTPDLLTIDISFNKNLNKPTKIKKVYDNIIQELNQLIETNYSKHVIAHIIIDQCIIDEKIYIELPENQLINNLKIDFKIICFPKILISKLKKEFIKNNLNVIDFFCTSFVKSLSYTKKLNINNLSYLEIGWERTTLLYYKNYKLKLIKSIPIGGSHITKDISKVFNISLEDAEKIKKLFNMSETEFSYQNEKKENLLHLKDIISKNISINLIKKVILYRIQEIMDLIFRASEEQTSIYNLEQTELFLIGEGSTLLNNNSIHLNDKFNFKSINFYPENSNSICYSGLLYHLNSYEIPKIIKKKQGIFEKFFNYFGK